MRMRWSGSNEAESRKALNGGREEARVRRKVEMLPTLDGQGRLYNVGYSAACSGAVHLVWH
jgi:hypothetical protein